MQGMCSALVKPDLKYLIALESHRCLSVFILCSRRDYTPRQSLYPHQMDDLIDGLIGHIGVMEYRPRSLGDECPAHDGAIWLTPNCGQIFHLLIWPGWIQNFHDTTVIGRENQVAKIVQ